MFVYENTCYIYVKDEKLFLTIIIVILLVALGVSLKVAFKKVDETDPHRSRATIGRNKSIRLAARVGAGVLAFVVSLVVLSSTVTIIEAKNVGVLTTFGRPTASLTPGLHFKAPWQKVAELDGTNQTQEYREDSCIQVRIGDGTTACVYTTIRWRIVGEKAEDIYAGYRSDDVNETVRTALVSTVFKAAVNQVLGTYNPTEDIRVIDPEETNTANVDFAPDYDALASSVTESMKDRVEQAGGLIEVLSITISYISISETTQSKINAFQAEVANTQVALQRKATAAAQAAANAALSESVNNDPNVLVSKCLDTLQEMVEKGQSVPPAFTCWPGSSSAVVLPSAPAAQQ